MQIKHINSSSYYQRINQSSPTCIDLFCGAGGLTLGFCQAGGIPVGAVDSDKISIATYRQMFPMCQEVHCGSIEAWQPNTKIEQVDVVIGGPPCQGFSQARGLRFVDDPRNHLYKHFVRLVNHFQPTWIVMENVPGIKSIGKGVILQQIYEDFEAIGYWLDCKVINMADYGVPQSRKRAIFVGSRIATSFNWPEPTHHPRKKIISPDDSTQLSLFENKLPYQSVLDALGDLPWPMGQYFSHRANSQMRGPRNRKVDTEPAFTLRIRGDEFALCQFPAQGAFIPGALPDVDFVYRYTTNSFQQMMREEPPAWIEGYVQPPVCNRAIEELIGTRRLAVREQARLQTFPDWYTFTGNPYAQGKQIGNAVPPLFAKQLFEAIFKQLGNSKRIQRQICGTTESILQEVLVST
ncbi:DNA cytosine methyltransferase [Nostoc sp. FACHB-888]|uniref:DNA cytosine methyltransferase n=1 Tax=Nostoc sp. FACHB-888 TaxID=2692842 RepID=UPI0016848656|nr:DNA cytosine methyltransferase [Nostoc sp. FACHB-888]MBD2247050.1 DNA cytosine methyltransferase [Nostoc sp. FACHB-888]